MKLSDIQGIDYDDLMRLDTRQLHDILNVTRSASRKRMARIKNSDYGTTIAYYNYDHEGGAKSTRGMNLNQLRHELGRDLKFLKDKTSTLKGMDEVRMEFQAKISNKLKKDVVITRENYGRYWDIYEKLAEDPTVAIRSRQEKYSEVMQELASVMTDKMESEAESGKDDDAIIDEIRALFDDDYKAEQRARNRAIASVSGGGTDVSKPGKKRKPRKSKKPYKRGNGHR